MCFRHYAVGSVLLVRHRASCVFITIVPKGLYLQVRHEAFCVFPPLRCKVCLCNPTQSCFCVSFTTLQGLSLQSDSELFLCLHHYAAGSVFVIRHRALCVSISSRCKVFLCNPTQSSLCVSIITLQVCLCNTAQSFVCVFIIMLQGLSL